MGQDGRMLGRGKVFLATDSALFICSIAGAVRDKTKGLVGAKSRRNLNNASALLLR